MPFQPKNSLAMIDDSLLIGHIAALKISDRARADKMRKEALGAIRKITESDFHDIADPKRRREALIARKKDVLARREALILFGDAPALTRVIEQNKDYKHPHNLFSAELARTHILYHKRYEGYGNAIVFNIPPALTYSRSKNLPQDVVRSDAIYTAMYSILSGKKFVKKNVLSKSEQQIHTRLNKEKKKLAALLENSEQFLSYTAKVITEETLPPDLAEPHISPDLLPRRAIRDAVNPLDIDLEIKADSADDGGEETRTPRSGKPYAGAGGGYKKRTSAKRGEDEEDSEGADAGSSGGESLENEDPSTMRDRGIRIGTKFAQPLIVKPEKYRVYTGEFDEVVHAADLFDDSRTQMYYMLLAEGNIRPSGFRLPNLRTAFASRVRSDFLFRQEDGAHLDPGALHDIVTAQLPPSDIYMQSRQRADMDTAVVFLLDNSGSMRGQPINFVVRFLMVASDMLQRAGIPFEVLGFTTKRWMGGQSREKWLASKKPSGPGRLNDIRHIIYKDVHERWNVETSPMALMLREGLLKENIDGEAVEWAEQRLLTLPQSRKILIPLSDGAPVDDSTLSVNPGNYLERHLHAVIQRIEREARVEIHALGLGYDTSKFYVNNYSIVSDEDPFVAAAEIIESIASYAPGNERRLAARLRRMRAADPNGHRRPERYRHGRPQPQLAVG